SATGRKVHNIIDAEFEFKDGKILRHRDTFDFWAWSRQALGPAGWVAGWSSVLQNKVRAQAAKGLSIWIAKAQEAR
ncbi:MAG TPA: nuclear transport factor 2 family protein, partial [Myxococcota bacterium]|nr:nuclear transport factor 2 family protein [Myxococcota bacterium]